jgi:thiol-disulfide isomerase/thioredoxin
MKKYWLLLALPLAGIYSCRQNRTDQLVIHGTIKNAPAQKVFLQEISFTSQTSPIIDSATIAKDGSFKLSTLSRSENVYRLLLNSGAEFLVINDNPDIELQADALDFRHPAVKHSDATEELYQFLNGFIQKGQVVAAKGRAVDSAKALVPVNDSLVTVYKNEFDNATADMRSTVEAYVNIAKSPAAATYGLMSATQLIEPEKLLALMTAATKRFPGYSTLTTLQQQLSNYVAETRKAAAGKKQLLDATAPEITLDDTEGKPFSLSGLRGKYVLVDFWASWCPPCRKENPAVVAAFNKFKNRNFTILGVSLDEDAAAWKKAIKDDGLAWKQVSELKGWESRVVADYRFNSIPFNALLDTAGKVIATDLHGAQLETKLSEIFNTTAHAGK